MSNDHPLNPTHKDDAGGSPPGGPMTPTNPSTEKAASRAVSDGAIEAAGASRMSRDGRSTAAPAKAPRDAKPPSIDPTPTQNANTSGQRFSSEQELPDTTELTGEKLSSEARETVRNLSESVGTRPEDQRSAYGHENHQQSPGDRNSRSVAGGLVQYTRDRPAVVVGAAAALGFLFARLVRASAVHRGREHEGAKGHHVPGFARNSGVSPHTSIVPTTGDSAHSRR